MRIFDLYKSWRYRQSVCIELGRIFSHVKEVHQLKSAFKIAFEQSFYDAIEAGRKGGAAPHLSAVYLTIQYLPYLAVPLSPDQRELTLFALIKGNEAEEIAGNLFSMVRNTRSVAGDALADEMFVKMVGVFNGLEGDALNKFAEERISAQRSA